MREILVRRRRNRSALLNAALICAEHWQWPVVPGAGLQPQPRRARRGGVRSLFGRFGALSASAREAGESPAAPPPAVCACPRPDCAVPGAHPHDPGLLAATSDPRMVRWWWTNRPSAPIVLATGTKAAAVSLPALAGARALAAFDRAGVRLGPVTASPTRFTLLVRPYALEELGELLEQHEWVPTSLRYHGSGGYVVLPPSTTGAGAVKWVRPPVARSAAPWLPTITTVINTLVAVSSSEPDGSRLAY
ncbi:bifunctional DNA primase/polymerase [Streptomyces capparidis]